MCEFERLVRLYTNTPQHFLFSRSMGKGRGRGRMRSSEDWTVWFTRVILYWWEYCDLERFRDFFGVCHCGGAGEDEVVLMVLSLPPSSPPFFPSHSLRAWQKEEWRCHLPSMSSWALARAMLWKHAASLCSGCFIVLVAAHILNWGSHLRRPKGLYVLQTHSVADVITWIEYKTSLEYAIVQ